MKNERSELAFIGSYDHDATESTTTAAPLAYVNIHPRPCNIYYTNPESFGIGAVQRRSLKSIWLAMDRRTGISSAAFRGAPIPLSAGLKQAAILAEPLEGIHLEMVYSSTLRRSRDTAEIARGDAQLKSLIGLNERSLGKFEGKWLDRAKKDPATAQEYPKRSRDPNDEIDGEESWNQVYKRVRAAVADIRRRHSSGQFSLSHMLGRIK
jgi:hypothetical protein